MADAVQYDIMVNLQTDLRSLTFSAQGSESVRTIADADIVWEKAQWKGGKLQFRNNNCPGIVITPANRIRMPFLQGNNKQDEVEYPFLCQIIDTDQQHQSQGLRTYMKCRSRSPRCFAIRMRLRSAQSAATRAE